MIFLKLDFSKAFDMVEWPFLFQTMSYFRFPTQSVGMRKLLFENASIAVKVNRTHSLAFIIHRGVRQGCTLAPYLFLIYDEVLNTMVKKGVELWRKELSNA